MVSLRYSNNIFELKNGLAYAEGSGITKNAADIATLRTDLDAEIDGEDEQAENGEQVDTIDPQRYNEALRNYLAANEVGVAATAEARTVYDYQAQAFNYAPVNNYTVDDVNRVAQILGDLGHPVR